MSWDVFISKTPVDQLEDAIFEPLGTKQEVIQIISEVIPSVDFSDVEWGNYRDQTCSIEFSLIETEEIDHFMMYVRGIETRPIVIIKNICDKLNCLAMDCSTGNQMNFDTIDEQSLKDWQTYRDRIINK